MRKLFGGYFAAVAVLFCWPVLTAPVLTRYDDRMRLAPYLSLGALVLLAAVPAMAAWSTWKDWPRARVWGVLASLLVGSVPLILVRFRHRPLTHASVVIMVLCGLALISYAWPDRDGAAERS